MLCIIWRMKLAVAATSVPPQFMRAATSANTGNLFLACWQHALSGPLLADMGKIAYSKPSLHHKPHGKHEKLACWQHRQDAS